MARLVANARMYATAPAVADAWAALFSEAASRAGVALEVVEHKAPAPLDELWARPDMGAVFMCGWPFRLADPQPAPVAAPIPDDEHGPDYRTDIIARADGSFRALEDAFGGVMAWTVESSHSGWNAPRRLLADHAEAGALFSRTVGPVITPRGAVEAVLSGEADIAPLDSYFHLLLRRWEPETAARLRIVARTPPAPIPLLVASHGSPADDIAALSAAFLGLAGDDEGLSLLSPLALKGFAAVDAGRYALAERWAKEAEAAGYPRIA